MVIGRSAAIRAFIAANLGCSGGEIALAFPDSERAPRQAKMQIWRDLGNQVKRGFLIAKSVDGRMHYWLGREPTIHKLPDDERIARRKLAQKRSCQKRAERRRNAREPEPRLVLPTVPIPAQAPNGSAKPAVETVDEFRQRNPGGYQVLPVNWSEPNHYPRIPDRLGAKA